MARIWTKHARGKSARSCWALKCEAGGPRTVDFLSLAWAKVRDLPEGFSPLGAAAKAFAMSLLDLSPCGADGLISSVHEVR